MSQPLLYYDLGSPYAYLAVARAAGVLGREPVLEPVLVGGIFALRGHGSWSQTPARAQRIAEVQERATRYGLAPVRWPPGWPNNTLKAMRACIWAGELGVGDAFARAAFDAAFAAGHDLSDLAVLRQTAGAVGLPALELEDAISRESIKGALKRATAAAWERGVIGVPCMAVGGEVLYGDDRLEDAARLLAAATSVELGVTGARNAVAKVTIPAPEKTIPTLTALSRAPRSRHSRTAEPTSNESISMLSSAAPRAIRSERVDASVRAAATTW